MRMVGNVREQYIATEDTEITETAVLNCFPCAVLSANFVLFVAKWF
jgi:hypothetical protein